MWVLASADASRAPIRVLPGSVLTVGRNKGHSIYLEGVQSVSRLHARIECQFGVGDERPVLSIVDMSKLGGVVVNDRKITAQMPEVVHDADRLRFASHPLILYVRWMELRFCTSRIDAGRLGPHGAIAIAASVVGARIGRDLTSDCTHLIMKNETAVITSKVACALILGVEIVCESWLLELANRDSHVLPSTSDHRPKRDDGSLICSEERLAQSSLGLFASMAFVFLSTIQMASFQEVIGCAGGTTLELRWRTPQHEVQHADVVAGELRLLVQRYGASNRLVLVQPSTNRMAPTARIRAAFERAGIFCNDESLIFASILDANPNLFRFVDTSRLNVIVSESQLGETALMSHRRESLMSVATPPNLCRYESGIPQEDTPSLPSPLARRTGPPSLSKAPSMALPQASAAKASGLVIPRPQPIPKAVISEALPQTVAAAPVVVVETPEPAQEPQPVVPAPVDESKPTRAILALSCGLDAKPSSVKRLLKNTDAVTSTAGNAVVIGFDIVVRRLWSQPLSDDSYSGVRNFKRFRKAGCLSQGAETSTPALRRSLTIELARGPAPIGMETDVIERLQHEQERLDRDENDMDDLFERAAQSGNTSRRRRR